MKTRRTTTSFLLAGLAAVLSSCSDGATSRALDSIRPEDMAFHQKFLSSLEFRGRNTPSAEQDIASKYIALTAERIGLEPLMPGGSFYQEVPVEVTTVVPCESGLRLVAAGHEQTFSLPADATVGRSFEAGKASGEIVFLGYGLSAPQLGWDDLAGFDLKGKVAVILDATLPEGHPLKPAENRRLLAGRTGALRERGAAAVVTIVTEEREARLVEKGLSFDLPERLRFPDVVTGMGPGSLPGTPPQRPGGPFLQVEVRHAAAAAILGWSREELAGMSATLHSGKPVAARKLPGRKLEIAIGAAIRSDRSFNVVAVLEGADPVLREEYLTICSHHDHNPVREGRIFPGSDDNISGAVGMFEIAEALTLSRPRRSVIFVWNTAEEKGLIGSYYFVQHCPVPVEKISANLDLDMISRNAADQIYLIGSNKLSSELDASIQAMNAKPGPGLALDYTYEAPGHPDRFFFRSDQYPYIRYGIPAVWFFCGTTEDYHTEGDVEAKVDYAKMEKVSELVYRVAMDIGDKPALLALDLRPEVKARGAENMKIEWK
ncbi:MAG: M28 family peptidase [Candidatus Aminicenantes bacterium]|nr:MAG: M28 family peptidase [Candidatus Aminicenantes bacterium]